MKRKGRKEEESEGERLIYEVERECGEQKEKVKKRWKKKIK